MKVKIIITIVLFSFFVIIQSSCSKVDVPEDTPKCVVEIIKKGQTHAVYKWESDSEIFYYFQSNFVDTYHTLFTENCEYICAPDGGIAGGGDGQCPERDSTFVQILIWMN